MVEMRVAGIALDAASRSPIVLLRDPSGRRQVPIWIDQSQAQNILVGLQNERPPRPLSHDLMVSLLEAGGLRLERVIIHAIEDSTFRAVLKVQRGEETALDVDARPSDGIALALRTGSSIWMLEEVVADASIPVDAEADAEDQEDFRRFLDRTSPAELIRHLQRVEQAQGPRSPEAGAAAAAEQDSAGSGAGAAAPPAEGPEVLGEAAPASEGAAPVGGTAAGPLGAGGAASPGPGPGAEPPAAPPAGPEPSADSAADGPASPAP